MNVQAEMPHQPVMVNELCEGLAIKPTGTYIDATYGRGGHSRAILTRLGPAGRLLAIDRDPEAVRHARSAFAADDRVQVVHAPFATLRKIVEHHAGARPVLGIVLDLGVSSPQLDQAERGFSFQRSGELDMRMDTSGGEPAARWLARVDEKALCFILRHLGEERYARRIARAIVHRRQVQSISTTDDLQQVIAAAVPSREPGKHPATRSFQAIRMHLNQELEQLESVLPQAVDCLAAGGRLVVISFHSLEDRVVKRFIRRLAKGPPLPPDLPLRQVDLQPPLRPVGKAMRPGAEECARNPRARSAVLRIAERTAHAYAK